MTTPFSICFGLLALLLGINLIWRLASRRYSLPCPTWLGWLVEIDSPFVKTYRATSIVQRLQLESGMKVLDVGCGPGRLTIPIAKQVGSQGHAVAIDLQSGMLRRAQG